MQLKATKLAALFALFTSLGLAFAAPLDASAGQWVRFTITKKMKEGLTQEQLNQGVNRNYVQLDEFGLYSADGIRQNAGLKHVSSDQPSEIGPGCFYYSNKCDGDNVASNLFVSGTSKWCYKENSPLADLEKGGVPSSYHVFTMHLREDAAPVVKYNLRSGGDTDQCPGRAPVCWKVETSDNGIDWVVRDVRDDQATSGYTTAKNTWYGGGGNSDDGPTTFYVFQPIEYPLPAGFTRLEWIKSTRQQHILTDYKPNPRTWMQVDCMFSGTWKCSKGVGDGNIPSGCNFIFSTCFDWQNPVYNSWFGDETFQSNAMYFAVNKLQSTYPNHNLLGGLGTDASRNMLTVSNGTHNAWLDWSLGVEKSGNPAHNESVCTYPLVLFGLYDNRNEPSYKNFGSYDMTVWSWKIYESDSGSGVNDPSSHLVHNFIPALSPTGVPGLFDSITGKFLSSATATPFAYQKADQWFRFTMLKKHSTGYEGLHVGELALYSADNVDVASGLIWWQNKNITEVDARSTPEGHFSFTGSAQLDHQAKLFDGSFDGSQNNFFMTSCNTIDFKYVFTIHLASSAEEVVKYNIMNARDVSGNHIGRSLSAWTLERSYDGVTWEMVDDRSDPASSGYNNISYAWYNNGGSFPSPGGSIADHPPTNFYWLADFPLPELLQSEYDYVGYKLVPAVKWTDGLIASGTTAATNTGTYKIVYSLPAGAKWVGGSTAPYELEWSIVSPRPKFLERLAADTRRVDDKSDSSLMPTMATGGDLILKDEDLGVFIHVFTNTAAASEFTVHQALNNVEILLVGGGGGGGHSEWERNGGGGGGAGGFQQKALSSLAADTYSVNVGAGGGWVFRNPGVNGGDTTFSAGASVLFSAIGGGHGGATSAGGDYDDYKNRSMPGGDGGCGGGSSAQYSLDKEPAKGSQGGDGGLAVGYAGAGGGGAGEDGESVKGNSDSNDRSGGGGNGVVSTILGYRQCFAGGGAGAAATLPVTPAMGGVGGGGFGVTKSLYDAYTTAIKHGENGLGGGGAAGAATEDYKDGQAVGTGESERKSAGKGGDGIVIVRYSYNNNAKVKVAKPTAKAGLLYNACTQLAVEEGEGYVLSGRVSADGAGSYGATASLLAGYVWSDGTTGDVTLNWRIDPAPIASVQLSATAAQHTGSAVAMPTVVSVTTVNGLTITDANCGWEAPRYERDRQETEDFTSLGYISVVVTGKGNLTGEKAATFRIYDSTKIPLPKPVPASYEYTGSAITPTFEPADGYTITPKGYTPTSGSYAATECGVYTVTCTLENGKTWENGSTGPYEVTWEIVKKQTFLEKLASDPRKIDGNETPLASGGDLVFFDPAESAFIHIFTNTADAATFTARQDLNTDMLLVGGGGGGGASRGWCGTGGGGGGAGGMISVNGVVIGAGGYSVDVGGGGNAGTGRPGSQGNSSLFKTSLGAVVYDAIGGGCGGSSASESGADQGKTEASAGGSGGSGGGHAAMWKGTAKALGYGAQGRDGGLSSYGVSATANQQAAGGGGGAGENGGDGSVNGSGGKGGNGLPSDILGYVEVFAGGGAGAIHESSGVPASGGVGGGGSGVTRNDQKDDVKILKLNGENGLGGGGAGGAGSSNQWGQDGGRGGDGIVIIRYMATPPITVPVPKAKTGLFYNGNTQVGVPESFGYTLSGHYATAAGTYTATATLNHGYRWADSTGDNDLTRTVEWTILNYMRLEALDNGSDPAKAGYVVLTNFHLTGANVVELKYNLNVCPVGAYQNFFASRQSANGSAYGYSLCLFTQASTNVLTISYGRQVGMPYLRVKNCEELDLAGKDFAFRFCPHSPVAGELPLTGSVNDDELVFGKGDPQWNSIGQYFDTEMPNDTLLFTADRENKCDGKPEMLENGRLQTPALAKMYYFRVENSATDPTPRLDLVPVQDTTTKARGFYDLVNGNFYPLKTPVVLDGNGGEPAKQYVYTSNGEPMPALPEKPMRAGFDFNGYTRTGWEIKKMTNQESDILTEGEKVLATTAAGNLTINGVEFDSGKLPGSGTSAFGGKITFDPEIGSNDGNNTEPPSCCTASYKNLMMQSIRNYPSSGSVWNLTFNELKPGASYLVQIVSHCQDTSTIHQLGVKDGVYYKIAGEDAPYGRSFVYRFVATGESETIRLYSNGYRKINAIQLRKLSDGASGLKYYDEHGTPVKACDFGEGTTLYAQWEPGKYHVIDPLNGPKIAVDPEWLNGAFGASDNYQDKLFTTNASGVVAWQAYVLGYEADKVGTAAIVEETVQNANPDTVTIRLRGMPEKPRTNETTRLAYSLLSARTPEGLLNGKGDVVRALDGNLFERCEQSTFEAPLSVLDDNNPVNYYRIKVHFIFGGGK